MNTNSQNFADATHPLDDHYHVLGARFKHQSDAHKLMTSLMLLIESLKRVASSSKPHTSCPTSVSLTADPAVILSLSPPPPGVSYLLKYTIHSSANTRLVKDRTAMMVYCRTNETPEKHQTGQIQSRAKQRATSYFQGLT